MTIYVFVSRLLQIKIYSGRFSVPFLSASPKVSLVFSPWRVPPHVSTAHSFIKPVPSLRSLLLLLPPPFPPQYANVCVRLRGGRMSRDGICMWVGYRPTLLLSLFPCPSPCTRGRGGVRTICVLGNRGEDTPRRFPRLTLLQREQITTGEWSDGCDVIFDACRDTVTIRDHEGN